VTGRIVPGGIEYGGLIIPWAQLEAIASALGITVTVLINRLLFGPPPPTPPPPPPGPIAGGDTLTGPNGGVTLFGAAAPDAAGQCCPQGGWQTWQKTVTTTESNTITRGRP